MAKLLPERRLLAAALHETEEPKEAEVGWRRIASARSGVIEGALAVVFVMGAVAACRSASPEQPSAPTRGEEFRKRVNAYMELHKREAGKLPKMKVSPEPAEVAARETQLADAIRAARPDARRGDIVGPLAPLIRKLIREHWASRSAADRKAMLSEVPLRDPVRLNQTYPTDQPLATLPPSLLTKLPGLPDELEYRLMGHDLIIRDVPANIIVDIVDNAVPGRS